VPVQTKNHRSNLWLASTDLSLSLPAKLAGGLGLKDVPLAPERDTPRIWVLRSPSLCSEIRLTRIYQIVGPYIPQY
jgi:hypothetical protein